MSNVCPLCAVYKTDKVVRVFLLQHRLMAHPVRITRGLVYYGATHCVQRCILWQFCRSVCLSHMRTLVRMAEYLGGYFQPVLHCFISYKDPGLIRMTLHAP